jgi:hypothetical protein
MECFKKFLIFGKAPFTIVTDIENGFVFRIIKSLTDAERLLQFCRAFSFLRIWQKIKNQFYFIAILFTP